MQIESIMHLILLIIQIESNGDVFAVGDDGKAHGALQLHAIYVEDVNRIAGTTYTHDDAFDISKSIDMFLIYTDHYATKERIGRKPSYEDIARIHNGGPNGWKKNSTKQYWNKIQQRLKYETH